MKSYNINNIYYMERFLLRLSCKY